MPAPGTLVREKTAPVSRTNPTDTGVLHITGVSEKGPANTPTLITNMAEFERIFGKRVSYSTLYDILDSNFREGLSKAVVSRVVGPTPVTATKQLLDGSSGNSIVVSAKSPGDWGNNLRVQVTAGDAGGEFKLVITNTTDSTVLETSPSLADQAAAVAWAATYSDQVSIALGSAANDPAVVSAQALTGGTDDHTNATDTHHNNALDAIVKDWGPGQVVSADRYTTAAHTALLAHAKANNRVAILDPPDTTVKATLTALGAADRALADSRYGALFAPWLKVPDTTTSGTLKSVPPSAVVPGIIARNDSAGKSQNEPSAGLLGRSHNAVDVKATFNETDRATLNDASVNLIVIKQGTPRVYGYRSLRSPVNDPNWWQFNNVRLYMAIAAKGDTILEDYVLRQIDGRGQVFKELEGRLVGMLLPYFTEGSLYGETPEEAFFVNTGGQVNTQATITAGEIHAAIELVMSLAGERVILDLIKKQIGA